MEEKDLSQDQQGAAETGPETILSMETEPVFDAEAYSVAAENTTSVAAENATSVAGENPHSENSQSENTWPAENIQAAENSQLAENTQPMEVSARERLRESVQGHPARASNFMKRGGLFEGYEITNAREMPFFMRVFAASALFHLVVFATALQLPAVVQTTCESTEFTQQVCDTIYVASLIPNRDFVNEPYDPTILPDGINSEDVTFISSSDFNYPEGYWTLQDEINGIVPVEEVGTFSPTPDINGGTGSPPILNLNGPQVLPNQNPNAVVDDMAGINKPFIVGGGNGGGRKGGGTRRGGGIKKGSGVSGSPEKLPPLSDPAVSDKGKDPDKDKTKIDNGTVVIKTEDTYNMRPVEDWRNGLIKKREEGGLDFYAPFEYAIEGTIDKDGKLVAAKNKEPFYNGNDDMKEVARTAVAAFGDTGLFKVLKDIQSQNVRIIFKTDGAQINGRVEIDFGPDAERKANGISGAINLAKSILGMKIANATKFDPSDKEMMDLLNLVKVEKNGTVVIINAAATKDFAEALYQKYKQDMERINQEKKSKQGLAVNSNKNPNDVK